MSVITEFGRHMSLNLFVDFVELEKKLRKKKKSTPLRLQSINNTRVVSNRYIGLLDIIFFKNLFPSKNKNKAFTDKDNIKSVLSGPLIRQ